MYEATPEFDAESVNGIVSHMNEDHSEALHLYIKTFTNIEADSVENILMTDIDADGICLSYEKDGEQNQTRISFVQTIGKSLSSVAGARGALVAMAKLARR